MTRSAAIAAACFFAGFGVAHADPPPGADRDVDRIPSLDVPQTPPPESSVASHLYAQGDLTFRGMRDGLVTPLPPAPASSWEARSFLDARITDALTDTLSFAYSGRFNLRTEEGPFPARETIRNDLREAYLAWQGGPGLFVQAGRINLKLGAAEGFNPTDYFKTRAVVEPVSADPTVLREDRLGTGMILGQAIWSTGSLTLALAPKLSSDSPPYLDANLPRFDPMFDRTNARTRALAKVGFQLLGDLSTELLAYAEGDRPRLGLNLTKGIGPATIVYLEWSGGRRASLAYDAYRDGVDNHVLSAAAPIPVSGARSFSNDLAIGAGYTTKIGIHLDLEYDLHQAGFSAADWRSWFDAGRAADPQVLGALWFIRSYAADQQEPIARRSLFLRADWRNALVRDLTITAFADTDLRDRSTAGQFTADYFLGSAWTIGGLVDVNLGKGRSDFGSLPQNVSVLLKVTRYLQ